MSAIAPVSTTQVYQPVQPVQPVAKDADGDTDGDTAPAKAAPAQGCGQTLDITA
jgi:hypothetical protein